MNGIVLDEQNGYGHTGHGAAPALSIAGDGDYTRYPNSTDERSGITPNYLLRLICRLSV